MRGGEEHWRTSRTVCHRLVTPLLLPLSFFLLCCERKIQSSASPDIKQDRKVGECKRRVRA